MDTVTRAKSYLAQRGKNPDGFILELDQGVSVVLPDLTGPQRRRLRQKQCLRTHRDVNGHIVPCDWSCKQSHVHKPGERCVACAPYERGMVSLLQPGRGPRDWVPSKGGILVQGHRNGKNAAMRVTELQGTAAVQPKVRVKGKKTPSSGKAGRLKGMARRKLGD